MPPSYNFPASRSSLRLYVVRIVRVKVSAGHFIVAPSNALLYTDSILTTRTSPVLLLPAYVHNVINHIQAHPVVPSVFVDLFRIV